MKCLEAGGAANALFFQKKKSCHEFACVLFLVLEGGKEDEIVKKPKNQKNKRTRLRFETKKISVVSHSSTYSSTDTCRVPCQ